MRNRFDCYRLVTCGAALLGILAAGPAQGQIQVEVNNQPVHFGSVGPAQMGGRVFIPLRAVVEALGAEVRWDSGSQTVYGSRGSREFALPIGARTARVNGKTLSLDEPARLIAGNTMVPLRFVAEALGADVEWNAPDQRVAINLPDSGGGDRGGRGNDGDRGGPDRGGQRVSGEVVSVEPSGRSRTLTVRVDGVRQTFRVSADAQVTRGEGGARGRRIDLDQLRPGDQVELLLDERGRSAEEIVVTGPSDAPGGRVVTGEIDRVGAGRRPPVIVVIVNGARQTFEVGTEDVTLRRGRGERPVEAALDQLRAGDQVELRLDRTGRRVERIDATRGGPRPR